MSDQEHDDAQTPNEWWDKVPAKEKPALRTLAYIVAGVIVLGALAALFSAIS